jgi:hypothetical protein
MEQPSVECLRMGMLDLQDNNDFQISAPQYPTHCIPQGNGEVLEPVVYRNIRLPDVTVSHILDSDHLPILFHNVDHVSARDILAPVESHTDWERFRGLVSDLISPRIQIDTADNADRAACNFAASVASAYRLSTRKVILSELNNELPELDRVLQLKRRLRKLWHETRDPACKTAVHWVTKTIRSMTRRLALERWETRISNCEVTSQAIWPIAKSLMKCDGPRHHPLSMAFPV